MAHLVAMYRSQRRFLTQPYPLLRIDLGEMNHAGDEKLADTLR